MHVCGVNTQQVMTAKMKLIFCLSWNFSPCVFMNIWSLCCQTWICLWNFPPKFAGWKPCERLWKAACPEAPARVVEQEAVRSAGSSTHAASLQPSQSRLMNVKRLMNLFLTQKIVYFVSTIFNHKSVKTTEDSNPSFIIFITHVWLTMENIKHFNKIHLNGYVGILFPKTWRTF